MDSPFGAGDVTRTHDLLITNQLHYRLCYTSIIHNVSIITDKSVFVKIFLQKRQKFFQTFLSTSKNQIF